MTKQLIEMDGVLIEVDIAESQIESISGDGDVVTKVGASMDTVKDLLLRSIKPITETYKLLNQDLDLEKAEIEVGVGFSAEGNIFIAKGKGSANLSVKLVLSPKAE